MKVFFIGTVEFSKQALEKLVKLDIEVVGVGTKKESSFNADFADLVPICQDNNIPFKYIKNINTPENIEWIKSLNPDIIFCFGWSQLIKKELLNLTKLGVVGFHPAALPQNRGRHPLIWALALGLTKTASTFFFMDEGADSGDILSQEFFEISYEDNAKTLYDKLIKISLKQIDKFVPLLANNNFSKIEQNHNKANTWRKRGKSDGKIDFRMSSRAIYNLVRALTKPYVGAHIEYKDKDILIWKVIEEEYDYKNIEPGKVLDIKNNEVLVKTYDGAIRLLTHEFSELPSIGEYLI